MSKINPPAYFELFHNDQPFKAAFDYDEGEEQWFDAKAGVGSPGFPPSVCLNEVDFGKGWESPNNYPDLNVEAVEQQIIGKIADLWDAYWAEYAESQEKEL